MSPSIRSFLRVHSFLRLPIPRRKWKARKGKLCVTPQSKDSKRGPVKLAKCINCKLLLVLCCPHCSQTCNKKSGNKRQSYCCFDLIKMSLLIKLPQAQTCTTTQSTEILNTLHSMLLKVKETRHCLVQHWIDQQKNYLQIMYQNNPENIWTLTQPVHTLFVHNTLSSHEIEFTAIHDTEHHHIFILVISSSFPEGKMRQLQILGEDMKVHKYR